MSAAPHVEFTKPLQDVEVREKESAKFECEVSRESAKVSPPTHYTIKMTIKIQPQHLDGGSGPGLGY